MIRQPPKTLASPGGLRSAEAAAPGGSQSALLAGIAFVDGVAKGWGCWELLGWFEDHLVAARRMERSPATVTEASFGTISLDPRRAGPPLRGGKVEELPKLLAAARTRVVDTLRSFTGRVSDDRFLSAAIYAKRVERRSVDGEVRWVPFLREGDRLSDIVLSLFAADILAHREFHEQSLSVCEVCGRISFDLEGGNRAGCPVHEPRGYSGTGFVAVTASSAASSDTKGGVGRAS